MITRMLVSVALVAGLAAPAFARAERGVITDRYQVSGQTYDVALLPAAVEHVFTRDIAGTLIVIDGRQDGPMTRGNPAVKAVVRRSDGLAMGAGDRGRAIAMARVICDLRGAHLERARVVHPGRAEAYLENGVWGVYWPCP
ncbi:hypothetical protein GEU84_003635 [Fertoebacter nigrum]|uniref:Nuclease n=1 Tax=Fertoeibacter niger TaxID=2656921 RepID=A0A8X8GSD0_9RHOB|nr:hypothetical protein [Fertoeibacter niger]NUB43464.1 hypothetical protein [Fertoeibacter niger]